MIISWLNSYLKFYVEGHYENDFSYAWIPFSLNKCHHNTLLTYSFIFFYGRKTLKVEISLTSLQPLIMSSQSQARYTKCSYTECNMVSKWIRKKQRTHRTQNTSTKKVHFLFPFHCEVEHLHAYNIHYTHEMKMGMTMTTK